MTFNELDQNQRYELKERTEDELGREIPMDELKEMYRDTDFVRDDFFCTAWEPTPAYQYAGKALTVGEYEKDTGMAHIAEHHPDIVKAIEWARAKMLSYLAEQKGHNEETDQERQG